MNGDKFQTTFASQYVNVKESVNTLYNLDNDGYRSGLKLSLRVKQADNFVVHLDVQYEDGSVLNGRMTPETSAEGWSPFCWFIPSYGDMRSVMVHLVHPSPSPVTLVDDVSLKLATTPFSEGTPNCPVYTQSFPRKRQIISNFLAPTVAQDNFKITIATQLTTDRWKHLQDTMSTWQGPISAVIHLPSREPPIEQQLQPLVKAYYSQPDMIKFLTVHLVLGDAFNNEDQVLYPINFLRNVAISLVETPYVFYLDVDVVPVCTHDLALTLITSAKKRFSQDEDPGCAKCAFVLPTFHEKIPGKNLPKSKDELTDVLTTSKEIEIFRGTSHAAVKYNQWLKSNEAYVIAYKADMEPYFIVSREAPLMSPLYMGYGRDKCAYSYDLHASGFRFHVLPDAFLVNRKEQAGQ